MSKEIAFYKNDNQAMNDSIDRIIVEIYSRKKENGYKTIAFTGCGSRNGTSTVAINVAIALADTGWKTVLVDCDMRKGSDYKRLNNESITGLSDYIIGKEKLQLGDLICETNTNNLDYIACGNACESPIRLLCSAKMEEFISKLNEQYDYVIFDLPPVTIMSDAEILFPIVDGVILVAALNETTKKQLYDAKAKANQLSERYYGLIVNKVEMSQYKKFIHDYDYFEKKNLEKKYGKIARKKERQ